MGRSVARSAHTASCIWSMDHIASSMALREFGSQRFKRFESRWGHRQRSRLVFYPPLYCPLSGAAAVFATASTGTSHDGQGRTAASQTPERVTVSGVGPVPQSRRSVEFARSVPSRRADGPLPAGGVSPGWAMPTASPSRYLAEMRCTLLFAALLVACSRKTPPPPVDGSAMVVPDAGVPLGATSPSELGEGPHDYRGTLGTRTPLSLHLVRSGNRLFGAYAYTDVGKAIALDGGFAPDGRLLLVESVARKVTGHFDLVFDGVGLRGIWSAAAGQKSFPLIASPGAPLAILVDIDEGSRAARPPTEDRLADGDSSAAKAEERSVVADDAGD